MKKIIKQLILFSIGGGVYVAIEAIYRLIMERPHTHWSMFILGGLAFIIIGQLNEHIGWDIPFWIQVLIGTVVVLFLEFVFGCILNIWLGLNVWDYTNLPFNLFGQICLPFAGLWVILVSIAIVLDDYIRYWIFGEEKPEYHWKFQ